MTSLTEKANHIKGNVSMIDFLNRLGFQPSGKPAKETMYISMLRDSDTDASVSDNDKIGAWYDHGMGKGGNIIDFARLYWKDASFKETLEKIESVCNLKIDAADIQFPTPRPRIRMAIKLPNYKIKEVKLFGITEGINAYLKSRGVFDVAAGNMQEVHYYVENEKKVRKDYFAAAWKNETGGWEVRNKYFKGCLGKKGVTFVPGDPKLLTVFEGYMNYLSFLKDKPNSKASALVLNSLALLDKGIRLAKAFPEIDLYLDRDKSGYTALSTWMKALPYSVDRSVAYQGYNDYNDRIIADMKKERRQQIINR